MMIRSRLKALSFVGGALAILFVPSVASAADEPPPPLPPPAASGGTTATPSASTTIDSVHLRNGGLYRGRVTEIVPGDHVTVQIEKGEIKKVPWAEIDRVIVASTAIPAPPTGPGAAAAPATPPVSAPMVGPRARVHISTSKSLILYRRAAGSSSWVQACTSPCNQELPIGDTYKVTGNAVASSKEFHLDAQPGGQVDISVDPPSTGGMLFGGFLGAGGASAAYIGMLMALIGASDSSNCSSNSDFCSSRSQDGEKLRNAGLITMAVGTGLTVAGILIFLSSAKTDIVQSSGKGTDTAGSGKAPPKPVDAFLREPTWKSAASTSGPTGGAPAASFPLVLQGTF